MGTFPIYPMAENAADWMKQAACTAHDWVLFEVLEADTPLAFGVKPAQLWSFNQRNHEVGRDICLDCPVMVTCGKKATQQDKRWTVRGGEGPLTSCIKNGSNAPPRCRHRKLDPRINWTSMKQQDKPACERCAEEADKIIMPRVAEGRPKG